MKRFALLSVMALVGCGGSSISSSDTFAEFANLSVNLSSSYVSAVGWENRALEASQGAAPGTSFEGTRTVSAGAPAAFPTSVILVRVTADQLVCARTAQVPNPSSGALIPVASSTKLIIKNPVSYRIVFTGPTTFNSSLWVNGSQREILLTESGPGFTEPNIATGTLNAGDRVEFMLMLGVNNAPNLGSNPSAGTSWNWGTDSATVKFSPITP